MPVALTKIFEALGVDSSAEIAQQCADASTFERMSGRPPGQEEPTAKARKGIVGDWKNYFTLADGELFDALAGEQMQKMGYEPNCDWVKELPMRLSNSWKACFTWLKDLRRIGSLRS